MQQESIFNTKKEEDLYSILGCVDTSSPEQIKTEYKRLALLHHPDKTSDTESEEFKKIKAAYDIIGNPTNRASYERWRSSSLIIPFSDFMRLGTHAQTVHWQSMPTQMTLTGDSNTVTDQDNLKTVRVPPTAQHLPRVNIETTGFWKKNHYTVSEQRRK